MPKGVVGNEVRGPVSPLKISNCKKINILTHGSTKNGPWVVFSQPILIMRPAVTVENYVCSLLTYCTEQSPS